MRTGQRPLLSLLRCSAAPEVLRSARNTGYDSKQADVWSSGVMLYAMLFCCYPFDRPEDQDDPRGYAKITQRLLKGAISAASGAPAPVS